MTRARDLGIPFEGSTGTYNALTDVQGVTVGYATVIEGESARTGVTVIHPRGHRNHEPVFAGTFAFNGNGEMTGAAWVEEGGMLEGPVGVTNTHSVGIVRDTIIDWQTKNNALYQRWSCPVVTETADGWLNDINGFHVKPEHVWYALDHAKEGSIAEGNVGGGTGMICHGGSSPRAITNAIRMAHEYAAKRVNDQLVAQLQADASVVSLNPGAAGPADPQLQNGRPST